MRRRLPELAASAVLLTAALAGCAKAATPEQVHAQRQAALDAVARRCNMLPTSRLTLHGTDDLHLQPDPNERYEAVDCALEGIKGLGYPMKMGFVGHETYVDGNGM